MISVSLIQHLYLHPLVWEILPTSWPYAITHLLEWPFRPFRCSMQTSKCLQDSSFFSSRPRKPTSVPTSFTFQLPYPGNLPSVSSRFIFYLSQLLSVTVIRHRPEVTPGGMGCLVYMSKPLSIVEGRNSSRGRNHRETLLTGLLPGSHSVACLFLPGLAVQMIPPLWTGPSQINQQSRKCHTELPTGQFWWGHFLTSGFPDPDWL